MKKVSIEKLVGGERLAKDITTINGLLLIPEGTILKKEYLDKLLELHIDTLYIEYKELHTDRNIVIEDKIQTECKKKVKETIEKYSYCANSELQEISKVADQIMEDIVSDADVMYNISYVRERNESVFSHSVNVAALSVLIGLKIKLTKQRVRDLAIGALLHDLGIVYLPFSLHGVIYDKCSIEDQKTIQNHVITGYSLLEHEEWLLPISKEIILSHHERNDGSGYPMRLKSNKLRIETKIVALCDEFDNRVYGNLCRSEKIQIAMDYILSEAGRKFDFNLVQRFIESVAVYPIGTYVRLNTDEIGIVIKQNYKMPTRPVIKILTKEGEDEVIRDLVKELTIFIVDNEDIS